MWRPHNDHCENPATTTTRNVFVVILNPREGDTSTVFLTWKHRGGAGVWIQLCHFWKKKKSCIYHYFMNCCFCFIIQHIGSNANFLRLPVGINNLILYRTWEKEGAGEYATTVLQKKHIFYHCIQWNVVFGQIKNMQAMRLLFLRLPLGFNNLIYYRQRMILHC